MLRRWDPRQLQQPGAQPHPVQCQLPHLPPALQQTRQAQRRRQAPQTGSLGPATPLPLRHKRCLSHALCWRQGAAVKALQPGGLPACRHMLPSWHPFHTLFAQQPNTGLETEPQMDSQVNRSIVLQVCQAVRRQLCAGGLQLSLCEEAAAGRLYPAPSVGCHRPTSRVQQWVATCCPVVGLPRMCQYNAGNLSGLAGSSTPARRCRRLGCLARQGPGASLLASDSSAIWLSHLSRSSSAALLALSAPGCCQRQ